MTSPCFTTQDKVNGENKIGHICVKKPYMGLFLSTINNADLVVQLMKMTVITKSP